jgi:ribosomal protein S8
MHSSLALKRDMILISINQNDALNNIVNAERRGKRQVLIRPSSKVVVKFLSVMQRHGKPSGFRYLPSDVITTRGELSSPLVSCFNASG